MHLVLFFTRSVSLDRWAQKGMIGRETALYQQMLPHVEQISFVTYGGSEDLTQAVKIPGINILCNRWGLPKRLYGLLIPLLHFAALRQASLFKTNQIHGADVALWSAMVHRKPLLLRAGYMWPLNYERENGTSRRTKLMHRLANFVMEKATQIIFTTAEMKRYAIETYAIPSGKISVIPNYIDTELFKPQPSTRKVPGRILAIGRLNSIKNLDLLIHAVAQLPSAHLVLVGEGEDREKLEQLATDLNAPVEFLGPIPNAQLPEQIAKAEIFAQVSKFEGHPKTIIEAMGCGAAVLGTDVDGIQTVIDDGHTGYLCQPTAESIVEKLAQLLNDPAERERLGVNALEFACKNYALEQIIEQELQVYKMALGELE